MARGVTILSLPAEILAQVFEETWKTRGASGLTPYLTVCRKWKEVADPVLFSALVFDQTPRLTRLALAMRHAALQGRDPLAHTRRIVVGGGWDAHSPQLAKGDITYIFLKATNLTNLRLLGMQDFTLSVLAIVVQACPGTMQQLFIHLSPAAVAPAAFHLRYLGRLQSLSIFVRSSRSQPHTDVVIDEALHWDMPSLRSLDFFGMNMATAIASFLGRCRFGSLRELKLSLSPDSPAAARAMAQFLAPLTLDDLHLDLEDKHQPIVLPHLPTTSLFVWAESLGLIFWDHLPKSVRHLHVFSPDDFPRFWASLDRLLEVHERIGVCDLYLNNWSQMPTWVTPDDWEPNPDVPDPEPEVAQVLLRYASLLDKRGINLRDADGKTVKDYFT